MTLSEKIRTEAQAERPCPTCGAERAYKFVWRIRDSWWARGTQEMVCEACGPFSDPEAEPRRFSLRGNP